MNCDLDLKILDGPVNEITNDIFFLLCERMRNLDKQFSSSDSVGKILIFVMSFLNEMISVTLHNTFGGPREEYLDLIYSYSKKEMFNINQGSEDNRNE